MKIAVYGTGAVGGYFGGRLAKAGNEVHFIARGRTLEALRKKGLQVESINGDFSLHPVQASDSPAGIGAVDLVIVGVKAWQVPDAARGIVPLIGPQTMVLPLQNGIEAPDHLALALGRRHVLGGLCRIISYQVEPGHIRHVSSEPTIVFGELNGTASSRVEAENVLVAMWEKFIFIASISGIGAVSRVPFGVVRRVAETRSLYRNSLEEILNVAQAHGIPVPQDIVDRMLRFLDSLSPAGTSSMQRDIMNGLRSELEEQNGAVVRLAREVGLNVPVNRFIYNALLPAEKIARGEITAEEQGP